MLNGAQPLRLELSASPGLAAMVLAIHIAASGCFLTFLTGWPGIALAALTLALGATAAWDRALLRFPRSPKVIEIHRHGLAKCLFANGESGTLQALGGSAVTRYWIALRLNSPRRASLFIVAGMLAPEPLRLLRLWALWGKLPGATSRQPASGAG